MWACLDQRHNARIPAFEVQIHYPYHPRCGQLVPVMFRRLFAGEEHLVVIQPDGTLALVPSWMSEEAAGSATLTENLRLSVDRLLVLRARLDALLASLGGESAPQRGGTNATATQPTARPVRRRRPQDAAGDSKCAAKRTPPAARESADRSRRQRTRRNARPTTR